ncbi:MAG: hypothetical protein HOE48_11950 [Candidatus Latescibacteria bacterium]|jgi:hypothetical protein|nr:hypothetical protein [Candidatus Latescibacterota bacterium]MBT4138624.1 hypothetical protein [Candidatus Latescibacterota bacterium]
MPDDQSLHDLAAGGRKAVAQAVHILTQIGQSTDTACGELFAALQEVLANEQVPQATKGELQKMMNTLQFQDVVSQQIVAAQTILAAYDDTLAPLADAPTEDDLKVDVEGAFDATANFDRERVDADDLDAWINEAKKEE